MLFEAFTAEGSSNEEAASACERIEDAVTAGIKDPKSRQYRDKARQIQLKLKVSCSNSEKRFCNIFLSSTLGITLGRR